MLKIVDDVDLKELEKHLKNLKKNIKHLRKKYHMKIEVI